MLSRLATCLYLGSFFFVLAGMSLELFLRSSKCSTVTDSCGKNSRNLQGELAHTHSGRKTRWDTCTLSSPQKLKASCMPCDQISPDHEKWCPWCGRPVETRCGVCGMCWGHWSLAMDRFPQLHLWVWATPLNASPAKQCFQVTMTAGTDGWAHAPWVGWHRAQAFALLIFVTHSLLQFTTSMKWWLW